MKKFILLLAAVMGCVQMEAQPPRLIIRGDDMGYSHSGNAALIRCSLEGIQTSIEVIVPSPWFPEAVKLLKENPGIDVGVHLAITSEWDNVKWRPVSDCASLRDEDGYFFPMTWPNKNYPGRSLKENGFSLADVEKEFRAQIELALKHIPRVSHISGHMGCTDLSDSVRMMTKRLAKEYNIDVDLTAYNVRGVGYDGPHRTFEEKKASFISMLRKLQKGGTYLFVDHPGFDDAELRAISHIGYENVAEDRQGVTSLWTDRDVKALIKSLGIQLISYRDLTKSGK
jgi:chitin disaccharide deacetylase